MKITARVDYAILAVFELAQHAPGERVQAREIALRQSIPLRFLEQIMIQLKRAGLVRSTRGALGGYFLGRLASDITLRDIVEAVEGEVSLIDMRRRSESTVLKVLREIEDEFINKLESLSIQELVNRKKRDEQILVYHI